MGRRFILITIIQLDGSGLTPVVVQKWYDMVRFLYILKVELTRLLIIGYGE